MDSYHGTSSAIAITLVAGQVSAALGGGELGRGFYTGEYIWEAKAWAIHRHGEKQRNVVKFEVGDDDFLSLKVLPLDYATTSMHRIRLRKQDLTRTFLFTVDVVWAPIVGSERVSGLQCKWESSTSEVLLNGPMTGREVL